VVHRPFDLLDDFNRAYSNLIRSPHLRTERDVLAAGDWMPPADIREDGGRYLISMDVPGINRDQIDITVHQGVLTVKGKRDTESKKDEHHMLRIERVSGRFIRQFHLPAAIDADAVTASVDNGVLIICLPKAEESTPKRVTVS